MKALGIGLLASASILGGLFIYNQRQVARRSKPDRKIILSIIKKLHQQMFGLFIDISRIAEHYASSVSPSELKTMIMDNQEIKQRMEQITKEVFTSISQEEFEYALNHHYAKDMQIQYNLKEYQEEQEKAFLGVKPEINENNIVFMSKSEVLECVEHLLTKKIERISIKMKTKQNLHEMLVEDGKMDKEERISKLKQMGFVSKDPTKIFQFLVSKYQRMDEEFTRKYESIVEKYKSSIQKVLKA